MNAPVRSYVADPESQVTLPIRTSADVHDLRTRFRPDSPNPAPAATGHALPTIPGFEIIRRLGHGGSGIVYLARESSLNRLVALKMVAGGIFADAEVLERFQREAESIASLQHPSIVQIFRVGSTDGGDSSIPVSPYIALEYVDSGTLASHVGRPISPRSAAKLIATLARAIQYAHERGIVHRDLKPGNVLMHAGDANSAGPELIDRLLPKVTDFGLAKRMSTDSHTVAGSMLGTPEYMSPEQASGRSDIGPASDVFALGVMLYELLTGRVPFRGADALDTLTFIREAEPVVPSRLQANLPRDLDTICLRALQKDPARRYPSAAALADDLEAWMEHRPIAARPVSVAERAVKWIRRRPAIAALLSAVVTLAVLGVAGIAWQWQRAEARADAERVALETSETNLYFGRIHVAQREYEAGKRDDAIRILRSCIPREGRPDRRGWEWRYLWNQSQNSLLSFHVTNQWVWDIAFSPDGRQIVTATGTPFIPQREESPGELTFWDSTTGERIRSLDGHTGTVRTVQFNQAGTRLCSTGYDLQAIVWDVATGRPIGKPTSARLNSPEFDNMFGMSGPCWFAGDDRTVDVLQDAGWVNYDPDTGRREVRHDMAGTVARTRDCKATLYREGVRQFRVVNSETLVESPLHLAPRQFSTSAVFPGGSRTVLAWGGGAPAVYDSERGVELQSLRITPAWVEMVVVDHAGQQIAVAAGERVYLFRNGWDQPTIFLGHTAEVRCVAFSPDGKRLASADRAGDVFVWDTFRDPRQDLVHSGGHSSGVYALSLEDDGEHTLHVTSHAMLCRTSIATRQFNHWPLPGIIRSNRYPRNDIQFASDGKSVFGPLHDEPEVFRQWSVPDGKIIRNFDGHRLPIMGAAVSGDGRRLATRGATAKNVQPEEHELIIWDVASGEVIGREDDEPIIGLALSADGSLLITSNRKGEIAIRETATQRVRWRQLAHPAPGSSPHSVVFGLAFSSDSKWVASTGFHDGLVRVWDVGTGEPVTAPLVSRPSSTGVCFTPDDKRVVAAGYDSEVRMWDIATGQVAIVLSSPGGPRRGDTAYSAKPVFSRTKNQLLLLDHSGLISRWNGR